MSTSMTTEEREAFLREAHIGVLSIPETGKGPLSSQSGMIMCQAERSGF